MPGEPPSGEFKNPVYLEVDASVLQPVGAALVQEVDVFDEQAEERDDDLRERKRRQKEKGI